MTNLAIYELHEQTRKLMRVHLRAAEASLKQVKHAAEDQSDTIGSVTSTLIFTINHLLNQLKDPA